MVKLFFRNLKISVLIISGLLVLHAYSEANAKRVQLNPVEPKLVCMINDEVMGKDQIPVPFEGKVYYGCCEGCVERLKTDRSARFAKDPHTGKEVDKAKAVIIEGKDGAALYFETKDTAKQYLAPEAKK